MKWLNFLHFYQPAGQQKDILEAVVKQSYQPILEKVNEIDGVKMTMNISGSLLELFEKYDYGHLIELIKNALKDGKLELTGSCKYHAFLPLIPEEEAIRQIQLNEETLHKYFGGLYQTAGFFPPEMGYYPKIAPMIEKLGFKWIVLDEIANPENKMQGIDSTLYKIKDTNLKVFFRNRRISNMIMSAVVSNKETLRSALKTELAGDDYFLTGMDGETFGHHRVGLERLLFLIVSSPEFSTTSISQFMKECESKYLVKEVTPISSTWASSPLDIKEGIQFLSWFDKSNIIHKFQWDFLELALKLVHLCPKDSPKYEEIRHIMDIGIASDHFWWASGKPWWSLEMIENGAFQLMEIVRKAPNVSEKELNEAHELYQKIVSTAFEWQRSGKIREMNRERDQLLRIPFVDRTVSKGGAEEGVYYAFTDMIKDLEKKAAEKGEYEKAILWRDALFKFEKKLDMYDVVNAIELLRQEIPHEEVEAIIEKYKEKYRQMRGGQPEQRGR